MRLALTVVIAAVGGLALALALTSQDETLPPDLRRAHSGREVPTVVKPPTRRPVKVSGAHGTNVFTPRNATAVLDDGEEVPYGALLVWCARFDAITDETFRVEDVRVIMNNKPETRGDLDKHVVIPRQVPPERIGDLLLDAMGQRASGVRATTALFEGGRDLESARKIAMQDGVTIHLLDPDDPDRTAKIECGSIRLELDHGRVIQGSTDDRVTITTSTGVIRGRGLSFVIETGVLRIEHDISGDLTGLSLVDGKSQPVRLAAKGPLLYRPKDASNDRAALRPVGAFHVENDVVMEQGAYVIRGQKLNVHTRRGRPIIEGLDIEGAVTARTPEGTFNGDRITWTREASGGTMLVLVGAPIKATLKDAARSLPGIGAQGDLDLSTDGKIVFEGGGRPDGEDRKITIGPVVTMTGRDDTRVDTHMIEMFLRCVASNRAAASEVDTELYPVRIVLDGDVRGQGPAGSFRCGTLDYERTIAANGRPTRDRITLTDGPVLRYLPSTSATETETTDQGRIRNLLSGSGPLHIRADNTIAVTIDPLRTGPIEAEARGGVRVQRFDSETPDLERGRLHAEEVDLVLVERFVPDLEAVGVRVKSTRRVSRATARRHVRLSIPDRLQGNGDALTWDGVGGVLQFTRLATGPAVVIVTDRQGHKQTLRAPRLVYRQASRIVEAMGGVHATLNVPLIAYGPGRSRDPVVTEVRADEVAAWLDTDGKGGRFTEFVAKRKVTAKQPSGAGIACDYLRVNFAHEEMIVQGSPARLDFVRIDGGRHLKEWVIAPSMVSTNGETLLGGPVQARLHSKSKGLAMNVAGEKREAARSDALIPIDIVAARDLCLTELRVQARGPAVVTQGDPTEDGFRLNGERIVLFLNKPEASGAKPPRRPEFLNSLDVARAVVEGAVEFVSPELEAKGDVIEFDRGEKVITLYRHVGNASLLWKGQWQVPRPRFDLHLRDPDNQRVISTLSPPDRGNR